MILVVALFEVTPWITTLAVAVYGVLGALAIVTGVTKRTQLIRVYALAVLLAAVVVVVCALVNVTTYSDTLTKHCARHGTSYEHCERARFVALTLICVIVGANVLCCGVCGVSAAMFAFTNASDRAYRQRKEERARFERV